MALLETQAAETFSGNAGYLPEKKLVKIIRDVYFVDAKPYNKIMGIPITKGELVEEIKNLL